MRSRLRLARLVGRLPLPFSTERAVRWLSPPRKATGAFDVAFFGQRFRGDLSSFIDWSVYCFGGYARHELALLDLLVRRFQQQNGRAPVFADIGANVGNHTLFMAGRSAGVVAFEPFAPVREKLLAHVHRNALTNVTVLPFALGELDGVVPFHYVRDNINQGMGTIVPRSGWSVTEVGVRRGDDLPELATVDIIKIDVEGAEASVLKGLSITLRRRRPVILMELSDASRKAFRTEQALRAALYAGAQIHSVDRGRLRRFALRKFDFSHAEEILVRPN